MPQHTDSVEVNNKQPRKSLKTKKCVGGKRQRKTKKAVEGIVRLGFHFVYMLFLVDGSVRPLSFL